MTQIIDLGKLRFHFAGNWLAGTTYESNDIVKYGGNVYVYTNPVRTAGNAPTDIAYWALMVEGFKFQGVFDVGTQYRVGDGVAHGGVVYIAVADSQGATPPSASHWSQFADGIQWEGEYSLVTTYQKNDLVSYSGQVYVAKQDTTGNPPTTVAYWDKFVTGISPEGVYNAAAVYVPGDLVAYGANIYRCTSTINAVAPTDTNYWELFLEGNDYQGVWSSAASYKVGQTAKFGGTIYRALEDNTNSPPSEHVDARWAVYQTGINTRGDWATATYYAVGDVVVHGGNTYYCEISHTAGTFEVDLVAVGAIKWSKFNSGVRYLGEWTTGTVYLKDDIVSYSVSTYICPTDHTAGADFFVDLAAGKWDTFVVGAAYVLPDTAGNAGKYLQSPDGLNYSWQFANANDNVYYVTEDATSSVDDTAHGQSMDYAFASLRYACDYIAADLANRAPATIFVKDGVYNEQLPIVIPENVTIVGDGQRNCVIQPAAGLSDDGVTPNNQSTMFYLSSGVMIEGLLMRGMTGFVLGASPHDIETATIGGVFCQLNPLSTILKSPYVKESSAFSTGGVGAIVDGSIGPVGSSGSMVFHTFTQVHDGGAGFWIKDRGLSEIVSCFTYYCDFGLVATGGGKIRALNCNNSYGTYGSVSEGYDATEAVLTGKTYGDTLTYDASTLTDSGGFAIGDEVSAPTRANLTVTDLSISVQAAVTTSVAHGLYDGQPVSFTGVNEAVWQSVLGDQSLNNRKTWYADVTSPTTFKLCSNFDLTNYFSNRSLAGWGFVTETISDATRASPVVLTVAAHGFISGETVGDITGVGGMTQLNGNTYYVSVLGANSVALYTDSGLTAPLDGTGFTAYTSGGQGTRTLIGTALTGAALTVGNPKAIVRNIQTNLGSGEHRIVISDIKLGNSGHSYKVSVNANNKILLNGVVSKALTLYTSRQYIFEQNDLSNVGNPLFFSETQDGAVYTSGVSYHLDGVTVADYAAYSSGFAAATAREVRIQPTAGVTLYYNASVAGAGTALTVLANDLAELDAFAAPTVYPFLDGTVISAQDGVQATLIGTNAHIGQIGFALVLGGLSAEPVPGGSIEFIAGPAYSPVDNADITEAYNDGTDASSYIISAVSGWDAVNGTATVTLSQEKLDTADSYYGQQFNIRYNYSQVRLTGHDFLSIGTGGRATTNYPGAPTQLPAQGNEVVETLPGRVYFVSTDQDGNFRIGNYFRVDQATGRATLDASAFDLSGLTSLRLGSIGAQLGESINEFSSDGTLSGNSNIAVPTEQAVKTYADTTVAAAVTAGANSPNAVVIVSGNTNAALGKIYAADGAHTITLPTTPTVGDTVIVLDISGAASTGNIVINGNSNNIAGAADDLLLDVDNASAKLVYINSTYGWGVL